MAENELLGLAIMGVSKIVAEVIRARPINVDTSSFTVSMDSSAAPSAAPSTGFSGVSNAETLVYQLDMLLDDISHLETEHLPLQGKIAGKPCDCIAKAGRSLHRHAVETVSIAARQGVDPSIFSALAATGARAMEIGTLDAVASGRFDQEYLSMAGEISNLRKQVDQVLTRVRSALVEGNKPKAVEKKEPAPTEKTPRVTAVKDEIKSLASQVSEKKITREQALARIRELAGSN